MSSERQKAFQAILNEKHQYSLFYLNHLSSKVCLSQVSVLPRFRRCSIATLAFSLLPYANICAPGFHCFSDIPCLFVPTSPGSDNTQVSPFSHHLRRIVPSQYLPQPPLKKCATASPQQWPGTLCHWFTVSRQSVRQGGGGSRRCGVRRETARGATCPTALPHHQPPPCSAPGP